MSERKGSYRVRKVDKNQPGIVENLRRIGATVVILSSLGHGTPDILVGWKGENYLFEIKDRTGGLTVDEYEFFHKWAGAVHLIRSYDDALAILMEDNDD